MVPTQMLSENCFKGKVAVVTGSTRGIGKAIADRLTDRGCRVIYTGTKADGTAGFQAKELWALDLSDEKSIELFLNRLQGERQIDILVNNAGINHIEPASEMTLDWWEKILKVNLTGAMRMTKAVSKVMIQNAKGGRIVNMSSIFGLVSKTRRGAYSASKAGLIGLTRASALDLAAHNILVNALCPGFTRTDLTASILSESDVNDLCRAIPLGRFAEEQEIAETAVFLCSEANTYMTGQTLVVDGGFTAQ